MTGPLARVSGCDLQVPLVQGGECTYANFDYAASAPALAAVTDCVNELLPYYASVHRGAGYASQVSTACYERARESVARFCGAAADQVVVFTRNTTDALNLLAACVPGDVVVLDVEHHANLLAWRRGRRVVEAADTLDETVCRIVAELCSKPAALLAVTGASNVTGEVLPLARLAEVAHACGARILVDAAQLAPHRRIDDAAPAASTTSRSPATSSTPRSVPACCSAVADWLDAAPPYLAGGGAVHEVTTTGVEWAPAPQRHEAGTPNVLGVAALAAACDALCGLDDATVRAHEEVLCARLRAGLAAVPGVEVLRLWRDSTDSRRDRRVHGGRVRGRRGRGVSVGRARDRRPRRSVLRASAARAARPRRGRAGVDRARHVRHRRRTPDRCGHRPGGMRAVVELRTQHRARRTESGDPQLSDQMTRLRSARWCSIATNRIAQAVDAIHTSASPIAVTNGSLSARPRESLATPYIPSGKMMLHIAVS